VGCVLEFWMFFSVFLPYVECCLPECLCGTGAVGVMLACILCGDVYSAAVCWSGVELCVLMFCIVIICGVKYMILEIRQYFIHLFCWCEQ
jgi:hypothetical protein